MQEYINEYLFKYNWWQTALSLLKYGYMPMILALLLLYVSKQRRGLTIQLLEMVNLVMLSIAMLIILNVIYSVINIVFFTSDESRFRLFNRFTGPYGYAAIWLMVAQFAPLLFFFRKCRTKFWLPILLLVFGYPEEAIIFITNLLDVYWADYTIKYFTNFALKYALGFSLYSIVLAIVYWANKRYHARVSQ